jgi:quercetin dioxygenase-like cupin family protein
MEIVKVAHLENAETVSFGDLAHYRPLIADGDTPMRTGIQVSEPGYEAPPHSHPYWEMLLILDGQAEAWMMDTPEKIIPLKAGDMIALPPNQAHHSPERIVEYTEGESGPDGYPVVDN